ncbi:ER lumen protein retaining receptor family protein [Euphorbia peplus]|nr:ER lumen protein retaining receptor family protein [Euphorbia peplus]
MGRKRNSPVKEAFGWMRRQPMKVKTLIGVVLAVACLVAMKTFVHDHNYFFIAAESIHALGILVLIYKLIVYKNSSGLSLKSQILTALFLAVRLACSVVMEANIHTALDFATLMSTLWLIYMIKIKLKSTYIKELDNMPLYYTVVPSAVLAILIHPRTEHLMIARMLWAFCTYLESVSVLPQLRLMQNAKMIEPFTSHYVFALSVARFIGCAHWIIQVYYGAQQYLYLAGTGYLWFPMAFLAEMVQTFILADFCYYYIKSFMQGQLLVRMPV